MRNLNLKYCSEIYLFMKYSIFVLIIITFFSSCSKKDEQNISQNDDLKKKELELKEKELEQKEKELAQKEKELDSFPKSYNESLSEEEYRENTKNSYPSLDTTQKSSSNNPHGLNAALERLCIAINKSDKQALKEFAGLSPAEILDGFTNEFDKLAKPECTKKNNIKSKFNYLRSDSQFYMYAMEYGDGYGALLMSFENGKWIAKKFIHGDDLKKIKKQNK
jgi:hypothetical protein